MSERRPSSDVCKEIRDSAERSADEIEKLKKIRLDSDWKLLLGSYSEMSSKTSFIALQDWRATIRELEGHFITIRDQVFAFTAQAEIEHEFLDDLLEAVNSAGTHLHTSFNELQSHAKQKPLRTKTLVSHTLRLAKHADKIQEALQSLVDELHEKTGTRPLSRQDSSISTPPPPPRQAREQKPKRTRRIHMFATREKKGGTSSRNKSKKYAQETELGSSQTRQEQIPTPSSFESSESSRQELDVSQADPDVPHISGGIQSEQRSLSVPMPIESIPELGETVEHSRAYAHFRVSSLPTDLPSSRPPDHGGHSREVSFLSDATQLTSPSTVNATTLMKGRSHGHNGIHESSRRSSGINHIGEVELRAGDSAQSRRTRHRPRRKHSDEEDRPDNEVTSTQGDASDWDLISRESFSISKGEERPSKSQPQPTFRSSTGTEKSKYVSKWILQSQAPAPNVPLPALPVDAQSVSSSGINIRPSPSSNLTQSDRISFRPTLPELDLPDLSFSDLTTRDYDDLQALAIGPSKAELGPDGGSEKPAENYTAITVNKTTATVNTNSSQALPIQTGQTPTILTANIIPTADILAALDCRGAIPPHTRYPEGLVPPYQHVRQLGQGSLGMVDEVSLALHHPNLYVPRQPDAKISSSPDLAPPPALHASHPPSVTLARKSIRLAQSSRPFYLPIILTEIRALRVLSHAHIVKLAGTYEDQRFYALLMSPVGDRNLKDFLEELPDRPHAAKIVETRWLKSWFQCLSSVLAYIHTQGIRHEDIKPSNIIHRGSGIYLTDFSSATEFVSGMTTSTDTPAGRITRVYSAPEALEDGRHGIGADIFSMGCVFAEMATVGITHGRVGGSGGFWEHCQIEAAGVKNRKNKWYCRSLDKINKWFLSDEEWAKRAAVSCRYRDPVAGLDPNPQSRLERIGTPNTDFKGADSVLEFERAEEGEEDDSSAEDDNDEQQNEDAGEEDRWSRGKVSVFYHECIRPMLSVERKKRPKAEAVASLMQDWFGTSDFCNCSRQENPPKEAHGDDAEQVGANGNKGRVAEE